MALSSHRVFFVLYGAIIASGSRRHADSPPCRKDSVFATIQTQSADGDGENEQLVVFGGKGFEWERRPRRHRQHGYGNPRKHVTFLNDTWVFNLGSASWQEVRSPDGSELAGPSARWKAEGTTVNDDQALALFGGSTTNTPKGVKNDLWVLSPTAGTASRGSWTSVITENPPTARRGHIVVSNSTHLVTYGGKTQSTHQGAGSNCMTDLWAIPLDALRPGGSAPARWTAGTSFPGQCRWGATGNVLTTSSGREVLAVFGGRTIHPHVPKRDQYTYFNEIWLYDFQSDSWSLQPPAPGRVPQARDHHGAAVLGSDLWIFAGRLSARSGRRANEADVWSFALESSTWTRHATSSRHGRGSSHAPSSRFMSGVAAVTRGGERQLVVFGGEELPGSTKRSTLNDVWAFSPASSSWEQLIASHCRRTSVVRVPRHPQVEGLERPAEVAVSRPVFTLVLFSCLAILLMTGTALQRHLYRHPQDQCYERLDA